MKKLKKTRQTSRKVEKQLTDLEQRLLREMEERIGNTRNTSAENPTELLDMVAQSEIDYMSAVSAEADSVTIDEIEHALQRLRDGTYGVCEGCGERITRRRLQIRPFATLCVSCKQQQERVGYVRRTGVVPVRADTPVTVNLNEDELDAPDTASMDTLFRDVEEMEVNEMF